MSLTRFAGTWNVNTFYVKGNMVISPINTKAYILSLTSLTGGTDPSVPSANWVLTTIDDPTVVDSLNGLENTVTLTSPNASITINPSGQDIQLQSATQSVYQATYYKSVQQNLVSPNTDITFDVVAAWNNANGYITHSSGTANFTVAVAGLYQLEFNISVNANGATWNNTSNKAVSIDVTRSTEQAVIQNNALTAINTSYQQAVASSFYLNVGDIINLRSTLPLSSGTPFAVGILNTFDLNTFFTWRYITA